MKVMLDSARLYAQRCKGRNDSLTEVRMFLTNGELLALQNMLRNHQTAVQSDVCAMFTNALIRAEIDPEKL